MTLDKTVVRDLGDHWEIRRHDSYSPLKMFAKDEPGSPGVKITPSIDPSRIPDVMPGLVEVPKSYGGASEVLDVIVPNIIAKEKECPICAAAKLKVDALINGDSKPEDLVEDSNPEHVSFLRGLLNNTLEALPRPKDIFPKLGDLLPKN